MSGPRQPPAGPAGIDPARLAEVVVTRANGVRYRGSGYRITETAVLTANHVLTAAAAVELRFETGMPSAWAVHSTKWSPFPGCDLAIVTWQATDDMPQLISPPPIGAVGERAAVLEVQLAGFPRWKARDPVASETAGLGHREPAHEPGIVAVLANRREGTLQITVAAPAAAEPGISAWEGISGGPVFAGERLIAVITAHHHAEGLNRLAATRIDRCLELLGPDNRRRLRDSLGIPPNGELNDVVPPTPAELVHSAYREQIRDIAPRGGLLEREEELDELTAFCAGDEPYLWWQAEPWAGKTALLSTFVLQPPAGVEAVSFFVTARLVGETDSTAFTDALTEQLAAITGQQLPMASTATARDGHRRRLLADAARHVANHGRRLVLVVDGIDEDTGPGSGLMVPSIASLLPKHCAHGLKVILAGRPHPPIPVDVAADHPLRECRIRQLRPSAKALAVGREAQRELGRLLAAGGMRRDILGTISASGGGLSIDDLERLSGQPRFEIRELLSGVFGRTVQVRTDRTTDTPRNVYIFAHETLRAEAEDAFGPIQLREYRERIDAWADESQKACWPVDSPAYLLQSYCRILRPEVDLPRIVAYATDHARHDRMLRWSGGDSGAIAEVLAAQDAVRSQADPDPVLMIRLAAHRDVLVHRTESIPPQLPALWARLGYVRRAAALARSMSRPEQRDGALRVVARETAAAGEVEQAAEVALSVADLGIRFQALLDAAQATPPLSEAIDDGASTLTPQERAERLTRVISTPWGLLDAIRQLLTPADTIGRPRATGLLDEAERLIHSMVLPRERLAAVRQLVTAAAVMGEPHRAIAASAVIADSRERVAALTEAVTAAVWSGRLDHAVLIAWAVTAISPVALDAGESARREHARRRTQMRPGHALELFRQRVSRPATDALLLVLRCAALLGESDRAAWLAGLIHDVPSTDAALADVARSLFEAGDGVTAASIASMIRGDAIRLGVQGAIAKVVVTPLTDQPAPRLGRLDVLLGLQWARHAISFTYSTMSLGFLFMGFDKLTTLAGAASFEEVLKNAHDARQWAETILATSTLEPFHRVEMLSSLALHASTLGSADVARTIAKTLENAAWSIPDTAWQAHVLTTVTQATIATNDLETAKLAASTITEAVPRRRALSLVLRAAARIV